MTPRFINLQESPTPVAPVSPDATGKCGELVTVAQAHFDEFGEFDDIAWIKGFHPHPECIQLVTRSQAVELLAAERAEKEAFAEEIKEAAYEAWPEASDVGSDAPHIIRQLGQERDQLEAENARLMKINEAHCQTVNTLTIDGAHLDGIIRDLKADNAAKDAQLSRQKADADLTYRDLEDQIGEKDARIKELEAALDSDPDGSGLWRFWSKKSIEANQQLRDKTKTIKALEAKLAVRTKTAQSYRDFARQEKKKAEVLEAKLTAAEKALEGLREKGRKDLDVLKAWEDDGDLVNSGKIVSDFRAALGGKPS